MSTQLGNKSIMARNIQYYMDLTGKTRNDMCEAFGVKYTTFTDWVKGKTYPRIDSIEKMANYFGVEKSDLIEPRTGLKEVKALKILYFTVIQGFFFAQNWNLFTPILCQN